ncbi:transposase, IS4 [Plesiocystis pacifica SIR-1]|uniref:Transposase, IS4 n=1 Tax=Plesiocystis pacifica SIR-1 TaxID=391625 RepID=A6FXH7_9BACT|nr:transposase, IS4 [Plesiocystis pacifica SIR-1]
MGKLVFAKIVELLVDPDQPLELILDDTLSKHRGPKIFGLDAHLDAVRSTKTVRMFAFGHVWVVLAISVELPFSQRHWALPIAFRLYQTVKGCEKRGVPYKKKTELGRDMVDMVARWAPDIRFRVLADSAYANATLIKGRPSNVTFIGSMRTDSVLTAVPTKFVREPGRPGRPRLRGERLPKPFELAEDDTHRWKKTRVFIYGKPTLVHFKEVVAQWYRVSGIEPLRVVIVRTDAGKIPYRVFFSTDPKMSTSRILEAYSRRWAIEVCFRDLKQEFGFEDCQARKQNAVERTCPFLGYCYSLLVLWFASLTESERRAAEVERPWYRTKQNYSFADVLRAARLVLSQPGVSDLLCDLADLGEIPKRGRRSSSRLRGPSG